MRKCRQCGFPKVCSKAFDWRSDGTVINSDRMGTESYIAFLEVGEQEEIFQELTDKIGISVDPLVINAGKNYGKLLHGLPSIKYLHFVPNNRFFRPQFLVKLVAVLTSRDLLVLGEGKFTLDNYKAGKSAIMRYRDPGMITVLVGGTLGVYETFEDIRESEYEYKIENGDLVVFVSHSDKEPGTESRLYLDEIKLRSNHVSYDRCPLCRTPYSASSTFEWDFKRGVIINRQTGKYEVTSAVQVVNAIFREVEKELGGDVPAIIYDAKKKQAKRSIQISSIEDADRFWQSYLSEMSMRGLGYPLRFEKDEDRITVETGITYNQVLYAARIAAGLEIVTGKQSKIDWESREDNHSIYTISI